jgi:hypothetical protein
MAFAGSQCVRQQDGTRQARSGEVCPCGWRQELGKHYAETSHVQWWREQIKERGSLAAVYREVRRRQREYRDTDVGYQRRPQRALPPPHPLLLSNGATADSFQVTGGRS